MVDGTSPKVDVSKAHENQDCNLPCESTEIPPGNYNSRLAMPSDFYGRTSLYYCGDYNHPSTGWIDEHGTGVGYDMLSFYPAVQGEDGSIVYYTSGYGYLQHFHHPMYCPQPPGAFVSNSSPVGHGYGPQTYPLMGPMYQQPVPPGVQYYSSPSFDRKQDSPSWGYKKAGTGCYSNGPISYRRNEPKHEYQALLSRATQGPLQSECASGFHVEDVQSCYDRTRMDFPHLSNTSSTKEQIKDTCDDIHSKTGSRDLLVSSHCLESSTQESQASSTTPVSESNVKAPLAFPKTVLKSNDMGIKGDKNLVEKNEKAACMQEATGNLNQLIEFPHENSSDRSQGPELMKYKIQETVVQVSVNEDYRSLSDNKSYTNPTNRGQYNKEGFQTTYSEAVFFIIKSYSEDDVHKSIKYSVWSSTPNGNKRLDGAYHVAKESTGGGRSCPVFLFFSVNSSGQFCGVAEMVGHVDFNKSMDFWLQGKWSGCFPVKWHIIKDVPNSQFRHIILANNDSKPVTHSRDTQQVKLEQGIEMLKIFKSFPLRTSLLDDFPFYDDRQRFLEERKLKRVQRQVIKVLNQKPSDNGNYKCPTEVCRSEGKESEKTGQIQQPNSSSPISCVSGGISDVNNNSDISLNALAKQSIDNPSSVVKNGNLVPHSEQDDPSSMKSINYKRALMDNVKGISNMMGNSGAA
eukprot:c28481_g2_i2 orf=110-2164(+)